MQPATRASFPVELLQQIGLYLRTGDVANVRLASVHFSRVFLPYLTNGLELELSDIVVTGSTRDHDGIEIHGPIPAAVTPYIKSLDIRIYRHQLEASKPLLDTVKKVISGLTSLKMYSSWCSTSHITPDMVPHLRILEEGLLSTVFAANVKTLKSLELQNSSLFPGESTSLPFPIPLTSFKELKFQHDNDDRCLPDVKAVLADSSVLETLAVSFFTTRTVYVQDIIPSRIVVDHVSLRTLALDGPIQWLPNSPLTSMPSLTQLRRLALLPLDNGVDELWDFLRTTNVWLECLNLEYEVSSSLTQYLTSYQGLQEFQLDMGDDELTRTQSDSMIASLRSHAPVLNKLGISMIDPVFSETEADVPLITAWLSPGHFSNLKYLRVESSVPSRWHDHLTFIRDILSWLEQFPALQKLSTAWSVRGNCPCPESSPADDIARDLVGTIGRPQYWCLDLSWDDYVWGFALGVQLVSEGKWRFTEIPRDDEFEGSWAFWF